MVGRGSWLDFIRQVKFFFIKICLTFAWPIQFNWLAYILSQSGFPSKDKENICELISSLLEKRDVDELETETDTRKLFLEQGTLEEKKAKEVAEYLDAKNKEVNFQTFQSKTLFS